ncbi:hypothetical protein Tco_0248372 [Tanacetum coccineum]
MQTKHTMGNSIVKMVKKVKKMANESRSKTSDCKEELRVVRSSKEKNGSRATEAALFIQRRLGHNSVKLEANAKSGQKRLQEKKYLRLINAQRKIKKLTDKELKEKFEYLMRSMERFVPMDTEKESRKRTGVELQTESSKKLSSDTREDVSVPKEKDKESVKREEEFEIKKPVLRYTKRKSLARKGLQKKPESVKSLALRRMLKPYMRKESG